MTKNQMRLTAVGGLGCVLLAGALYWLETPRADAGPTQSWQATPSSLPAASPAAELSIDTSASEGETIVRLAREAKAVPDHALLRLSGMVNIANALNEAPDQEAWHKALPIARALTRLPCDCGQQNWLCHFVEMGDYALAGAQDDYRHSAKLMQSLGRNDAQEGAGLARLSARNP